MNDQHTTADQQNHTGQHRPAPTMTLADAEKYAAAHGVILTAAQRASIAQAADAARAAALNTSAAGVSSNSFADRFNRFYPRLLAFIGAAGDTLITTAQQILASFGAPFALVMLLIVEHHRVYEGIVLFDPNPTFASFAALALVLLNLILELLIHHVEYNAGYSEPTRAAASIRLWWSDMAYKLGLSSNWTPRALSPAQRYKAYLRLVTFTILALALVGSMRVVIAEYDTLAWHEAIAQIITGSSLLLLLTWLGGLLFAAAAVLSAQALTRYVAIRTVDIRAQMSARSAAQDTDAAADSAADSAAAQYVYALTAQQLEKRRAKLDTATPASSSTPAQDTDTAAGADFLSVTPVYHNGNGRH